MANFILEHLRVPEACRLDKPVYKKFFQESSQLNATDKKALKDDVRKIRWMYALKPETIGIPPYQDEERTYGEVVALLIELNSPARYKRVAAFVNKTIPYPLLIVFAHEDRAALAVAEKRTNQADKTKWVVEDEWATGWLDPQRLTDVHNAFLDDLDIAGWPSLHYYAFYEGGKSRLIALNAAEQTGTYRRDAETDPQARGEILRQIDQLAQKRAELQNLHKKETQTGRQIELLGQIKRIADEIARLKTNI